MKIMDFNPVMIAPVVATTECHFEIKSENKIHKTVFFVSEDGFSAKCSCTANTEKECWHARYILAGRSRRLVNGSIAQAALLKKLSAYTWGQETLQRARSEFMRKESCRRCGSQHVILLKHSLLGKIVSLFKPNSHHHFCKSCKWSW